MDLSNLGSTLLNSLAVYGPQALALAALLGALGVPVPTPLLLLAAGALVRQGVLDPGWALLAWTAGSTAGEGLFYLAGRYSRTVLDTRAGRMIAGALASAQERFSRQPEWTVYLTRFLLTPLSIPTTLLAGSTGYGYRRFLASALPGDLMWLVIYAIPGYLLGEHWGIAGQLIAQYGAWFVLAPLALMGGGYLLKLCRPRLAHAVRVV